MKTLANHSKPGKAGSMSAARMAAFGTAAAALAVVVLGSIGADASSSAAGSFETAPALSCPSAARDMLPHVEADQILDAALTPAQVANAYVLQHTGWTNSHFNILGTTERAVRNSRPQQVEVDLRDMANKRIGVYVVTKSDAAWVLTRTFECAAPAS